MTILEKIKFEEEWLSEVNLTKENIKIAFAGIRATVLEQQPCDDCVSREAVIRLVDEGAELYPYKVVGDSETYSNYNQGWTDAFDWLYANIDSDNLPSVQPTRPKGKWIPYYDRWGDVITIVSHFKCSVCGEYDYDKDKFCPNCGADMRGEAE